MAHGEIAENFAVFWLLAEAFSQKAHPGRPC